MKGFRTTVPGNCHVWRVSVIACGEFAGHCERLSLVAGRVRGRGLVAIRDEEAIVSGLLLKQLESFTGKAQPERGFDEFYGLAGEDTPETNGSSSLTFGAPPQKALGGRVFRAEEFDALLADDSDKGLQHP
jgi:hypothetical protein